MKIFKIFDEFDLEQKVKIVNSTLVRYKAIRLIHQNKIDDLNSKNITKLQKFALELEIKELDRINELIKVEEAKLDAYKINYPEFFI